MRNGRVFALLLAVLFGLGCQGVWSEGADQESFVQVLIRALERQNWDTSDTGVLERQLSMYEWKNLEGVDPEVVALALSYGKERGIDDPEKHAEIALQVAEGIRVMSAFGLSSRESARAVLNGMRMATPEEPNFAEQLRLEIHGVAEKALRRRIEKRTMARPFQTDTWTPPAPEERPGGGRIDIPAGPGENPGPGGPEGSNGGR